MPSLLSPIGLAYVPGSREQIRLLTPRSVSPRVSALDLSVGIGLLTDCKNISHFRLKSKLKATLPFWAGWIHVWRSMSKRACAHCGCHLLFPDGEEDPQVCLNAKCTTNKNTLNPILAQIKASFDWQCPPTQLEIASSGESDEQALTEDIGWSPKRNCDKMLAAYSPREHVTPEQKSRRKYRTQPATTSPDKGDKQPVVQGTGWSPKRHCDKMLAAYDPIECTAPELKKQRKTLLSCRKLSNSLPLADPRVARI